MCSMKNTETVNLHRFSVNLHSFGVFHAAHLFSVNLHLALHLDYKKLQIH